MVYALLTPMVVHVTRDGKDLVAQLSDSRLVVIRDFMRIVRGEISMSAATLEIGKTIPRHGGSDEHFSIYLSYEHGRLGIVTVRTTSNYQWSGGSSLEPFSDVRCIFCDARSDVSRPPRRRPR